MKPLHKILEDADPQGLIDYLSDNPDAEVVKKLINTWETETLATTDVKKYIEKSGLTVATLKKMMSNLSADDCSSLISMMSKHDEFESYDPTLPLSGYLKDYIKRISDCDMSDEGICSLIVDKTAPGTISVGPGENIVVLLFKDTTTAKKSDVNIAGKLTEFKFGGGRVCTTSSKMTIAQVWAGISDKFNIDNVKWPTNGKGNDNSYNTPQTKIEAALTSWWKNAQSKVNKTIFPHMAGVMIANIDKMFGSSLYGDKKLEWAVKKILNDNENSDVIGRTLVKLMGCLCVIAYKDVEGYNQLLVQTRIGKKFTKALLITDFSIESLMQSKLKFSRPNASDSFKGMVINVS